MVSEAHASRSADQLHKRRQSARPWSDPARSIRSARAMSEMRSAERSSHLDDDQTPGERSISEAHGAWGRTSGG